LAIDAEGFLYIATYLPEGDFADNGQIKIFDPQGNYVRSILTSFYRPMGLDVDENYVYAAEYYDGKKGPEPGNEYSRIRIYDKNSGNVIRETDEVEIPMRIAIDSKKNVYVTQAVAMNSSKVHMFDENLIYLTSFSGITSPGSIIIDPYDFIYIIDYDGRIDFSQFINFEELSFTELQAIAKKIDDAQKANAFSIRIFDSNRVLRRTLKEQIDFPLDITFNNCERMYVNNAKIFGSNSFLGYIPDRLEFHLEIYKRTPSFDTEDPAFDFCPEPIQVEVDSGENYATVTFPPATATDNCSVTVTQTQGQASGSQFPVGTHTIEFTATDGAGNTDTCSFYNYCGALRY
jgi:large repetitive protein